MVTNFGDGGSIIFLMMFALLTLITTITIRISCFYNLSSNYFPLITQIGNAIANRSYCSYFQGCLIVWSIYLKLSYRFDNPHLGTPIIIFKNKMTCTKFSAISVMSWPPKLHVTYLRGDRHVMCNV